MSEKPVLFATSMVQAILDGRKTMTRRAIKPQPMMIDLSFYKSKIGQNKKETIMREGIPLYQPGDILWVRETIWQRGETRRNMDLEPEWWRYSDYLYVASDPEPEDKKHWEKRPSIHMPREAARIFLRVTGVRAERVQEMRLKDCIAEGIILSIGESADLVKGPVAARKRFSELWNSTVKREDLGKYGWDANPWVWVCEFEKTAVPTVG